MKKIFIVGGAGFVGSALVRVLLQVESVEKITVYDNFSSGNHSFLPVVGASKLHVIPADAKDRPRLTVEMNDHDTVIHLASNPDIARAVREPDIDFKEGTQLTQNVLEAARINHVALLVYASGSGVYGENPTVKFTEDYAPMEPISTYGASKLAGEAMISAYCRMFGMTGLAFRFANLVGPRQTHGVGLDFVRRLASHQSSLDIMGDGTQTKSYLHIDDAIEAMGIAVRLGSFPGRLTPYNVATDDLLSVTDIAHLAVAAHGMEPGSVKFKYTGGDRGWQGDVPKIRLNCAKLKGLGWKCRHNSHMAMVRAMDTFI